MVKPYWHIDMFSLFGQANPSDTNYMSLAIYANEILVENIFRIFKFLNNILFKISCLYST